MLCRCAPLRRNTFLDAALYSTLLQIWGGLKMMVEMYNTLKNVWLFSIFPGRPESLVDSWSVCCRNNKTSCVCCISDFCQTQRTSPVLLHLHNVCELWRGKNKKTYLTEAEHTHKKTLLPKSSHNATWQRISSSIALCCLFIYLLGAWWKKKHKTEI